jgi:hypothetical protein
MSKTLIPVVAIIVVVGGIILLTKHKKEIPAPAENSSEVTVTPTTPVKATTSTKKPKAPVAPAPTPVEPVTESAPTTTPQMATYRPVTQLYTVHASDTTADLKTIEINKGDTLNLTFAVDPRNNYHGGLDFRSDVISTGTVLPGQSKMISFVPDHSFSFTPYWPSSDIAKDYTIDIVVK